MKKKNNAHRSSKKKKKKNESLKNCNKENFHKDFHQCVTVSYKISHIVSQKKKNQNTYQKIIFLFLKKLNLLGPYFLDSSSNIAVICDSCVW